MAELHPLDGRGEIPHLDALAGLRIPKSDGIVCSASSDKKAVWGNIDSPQGTLVSVVGA